MIGIILLITLLIGLLALVVVLIYIRQSEVELTDQSVDLGDVLPIQTITGDAIINGNGDITVGSLVEDASRRNRSPSAELLLYR